MRVAPTSLLGTTLSFDRAGNHLLVIEPDAIVVVDVPDGRTLRLPYANARAVAGFDDQLWIATHDDHLVRVDLAGRPFGEPAPLPFSARAVLQPAPCGPAAAVWLSNPVLALIDDFGQLTATELVDV
jgi:hypothetical protein